MNTTDSTPSLAESAGRLRDIVVGYWLSRAVAVATELGLPDLLAEGPLSVEQLAQQSNTNAEGLARLLRALESADIFKQVTPGVYANNAFTKLLRKDVQNSLRPALCYDLSLECGHFTAWHGLKDSLHTGKVAFTEVHKQEFWDFLKSHPVADTMFNGAMRSVTAAATDAITAAYDWRQFPVIADIGGGIGTQLVSILNAHPSCRGILFDQQSVVATALPHQRMEVRGGSFFEAVHAEADAYLLRMIIHDWKDTEALAILKTVRRAMKPHARIILVETVVSDEPAQPTDGKLASFSKWLDVAMYVLGGKERTRSEHTALLNQAGFKLEEIVTTPTHWTLLVARPV